MYPHQSVQQYNCQAYWCILVVFAVQHICLEMWKAEDQCLQSKYECMEKNERGTYPAHETTLLTVA